MEDIFTIYEAVEHLAPEVFKRKKGLDQPLCANVDLYSGFVYSMLDFPESLFTPLFAISRIAGWSAHRMEQLITGGKIIRPAYKSVASRRPYVPINDRN